MSEMEWLIIFGDNIKSILYDYNMTQQELADAAGISNSNLSRYINKQQMPSVRTILNLSYALNCDVSELMDFGEPITD